MSNSKYEPELEQLRHEYSILPVGIPPTFPTTWRAPFLLSPYGDAKPIMQNYDQLVVADIQYDSTRPGYEAMICGLYLLEDLKYFRFILINAPGSQTKWYWLDCETPNSRPRRKSGPFSTPLIVPRQAFLRRDGFDGIYKGLWPACRREGLHFVVQNPEATKIGSWFMVNPGPEAVPLRVVNIGANNGLKLPFLGSYFFGFSPGQLPPVDDTTLADLMAQSDREFSTEFANPLLTQQDIQSALAQPLYSCPCALGDIQKLIPGIEGPQDWLLPEWTNQVFIKGTTLGATLTPYPTLVFYNDQLPWKDHPNEPGRQLTRFFNLSADGEGESNQRQDEILYYNFTNIAQYRWTTTGWQAYCKATPPPDGIGYPRRNFPECGKGQVKGCVRGNPGFNLGPDETIYFIAGFMPRPTEDLLSIFWWWFMQDQSGVLFSECELATPPAHSLSLIDYSEFERNAKGIDEKCFPDPTSHLNQCNPKVVDPKDPKWGTSEQPA